MTIRPIFAWFDLWIGAYWDRKARRLYILPLPCVGFVVTFRRLTVVIVALFVIGLAWRPAIGASMEVCRPYAAASTDLLVKYLWTRAYSSCLNSDDDPQIATTPVDALKAIVPLELLLPQKPIADDPPAPVGRSGYAVNTPGWIAYCKKYWPASFDQKSGTVIKVRHKRIPCPG